MSSFMTGDILPAFLTTTPWTVVLAKILYNLTGDSSLKSITGAQGYNDALIRKMDKLLHDKLLTGADRILYIKANAKVSENLVKAFIDSVEEVRGKDLKEGAFEKIDQIMEEGVKTIKDILNGAGAGVKTTPYLLIILAGGVAAYLFMAGRKGVKLTPF